MIFETWNDVLRVFLMGTSAYFGLIAILRLGGKRTLAKMSAFNLVVTRRAWIDPRCDLAEPRHCASEGYGGLTATGRSTIYHRRTFGPLATNRAHGEIRSSTAAEGRRDEVKILKRERFTGFGDDTIVAAVVLGTDGSFSVVSRDRAGAQSALPTTDVSRK